MQFLSHFLPIDLLHPVAFSARLIRLTGFYGKILREKMDRRLTMMVSSEACARSALVSFRVNTEGTLTRDAVQLFGIHQFASKTRSLMLLSIFSLHFMEIMLLRVLALC